MSFVTAAIVIGTGTSAYSSVRAGKAAKQEAQFNAAQMERDMELGRIEATQNATAMAQDYAQSVSAIAATLCALMLVSDANLAISVL